MGKTTILQTQDIDHLFYKELRRHPTPQEIAKIDDYIGGHFLRMANLVKEYIREMVIKGKLRSSASSTGDASI